MWRCRGLYTSMGVTPGVWSLCSAFTMLMQTVLHIFYPVVHQKSVLYVDFISLNVRILLKHWQNHTHNDHSHCFCNALLIIFLNQPHFSALSLPPPSVRVHSVNGSIRMPNDVYTSSHNPARRGPTGSNIRAFDLCQNHRPWMTLKGHYALYFKTGAPWCCLLSYFEYWVHQSALGNKWLQRNCLLAKPVVLLTVLIFRNLKQLTIKESLGVGKTRFIARFPCDSRALVYVYICYFYLVKSLHYCVTVMCDSAFSHITSPEYHSPSNSIWPHLSYGLVRSKSEYCHNCSLVVVLCSFL